MTASLQQLGGSSNIIFMWGRGQEGQLGVGTHQDSSHPRAVELLQGRKVLQVGRCWHSCKATCGAALAV